MKTCVVKCEGERLEIECEVMSLEHGILELIVNHKTIASFNEWSWAILLDHEGE